MRAEVVELAKLAGREILKIRADGGWKVTDKVDLSPVTAADLAANAVLVPGLAALTPGFAVVSEESDPYLVAKGSTYWLVDPLDGTRDFINGEDTFVVSIGLIDDGYPVFGVIHSPVLNETWWAKAGDGSFRDGVRISNASTRTSLIAAVSRSLGSERLHRFTEKYAITELQRFGSALKFCKLAEGAIDIYPRFGPTSEWDTAAGQVIAEEAGCKVLDLSDGKRLRYGKAKLLNSGGFVACRRDLYLP